jgi:hypothetical protein
MSIAAKVARERGQAWRPVPGRHRFVRQSRVKILAVRSTVEPKTAAKARSKA